MKAPWAVKATKLRYNAIYKDIINEFRAGSVQAADMLRINLANERAELRQHGFEYGQAGRYKRLKNIPLI